MNCTDCGREIKRGEKYVAVIRQEERTGLLGAIKVEASEITAAYHPDCAPEKGRV